MTSLISSLDLVKLELEEMDPCLDSESSLCGLPTGVSPPLGEAKTGLAKKLSSPSLKSSVAMDESVLVKT